MSFILYAGMCLYKFKIIYKPTLFQNVLIQCNDCMNFHGILRIQINQKEINTTVCSQILKINHQARYFTMQNQKKHDNESSWLTTFNLLAFHNNKIKLCWPYILASSLAERSTLFSFLSASNKLFSICFLKLDFLGNEWV